MTDLPHIPSREFRTTRDECLADHDKPASSSTTRALALSSGANVALALCAFHARKFDEAILIEELEKERYSTPVPNPRPR